MALNLEDTPVGQTFDQFCDYVLQNVISDDLSTGSPTEKELKRLFNLYDLDRDGVLSSTESQLLNVNLIHPINALRSALIVVDFQNDFVAGSLAIKNGAARQDPIEALEPLNHLLERSDQFKRIIYTLDWHPSNHISFFEHCRNSDRTLSKEDKLRKLRPFDTVVDLLGVIPNTLCAEVMGAELCPDLIRAEGAKYVQKGSQVFVDAYSGFVDNQGQYRSELEPILREEKIEVLFICGLALDICVAATAKDAAKLKFLTAVITDCSKGLTHEHMDEKNEELRSLNVAMVDSVGVQAFIDSRKMPWRWICQLVGLPMLDARSPSDKLHKRESLICNGKSAFNDHHAKTHLEASKVELVKQSNTLNGDKQTKLSSNQQFKDSVIAV
uniref:nicotinamidase n=1 Tax=Ditylenchus dipsaci TaxID=166011 RepID=A0A915EBS8_9BILA